MNLGKDDGNTFQENVDDKKSYVLLVLHSLY